MCKKLAWRAPSMQQASNACGKLPVPRVLTGCVIGAGPAGLYASKFLAENGVDVRLFEKDEQILGKYRYSKDCKDGPFKAVLSNPRVELHLNTHSSQILDEDCDFYVCATGGTERELDVKGKELPIKAMDIIRRHYGGPSTENGKTTGLGDNVCIIGMGNVAMDLIACMQDRCSKLTVLSRSSLEDAAFDNHKMREIVESGKWSIRTVGEFPPSNDRRTQSRYRMLSPFVSRCTVLYAALSRVWSMLSGTKRLPTLSLVFGTHVESIESTGSSGSIGVRYRTGRGLRKQVFDSVISSIGFIPSVPAIKTEKPVYYLGWCATPKGSISDSKRDAELIVEKILSVHGPSR